MVLNVDPGSGCAGLRGARLRGEPVRAHRLSVHGDRQPGSGCAGRITQPNRTSREGGTPTAPPMGRESRVTLPST
jgi:hypothetical protein